MDNEEINIRIKELIDYLHVSQNAFAKEIGISSSRISNITKFRNRPDSVMLQLILYRYRNVSSDWLLIGDGEMIRKDEKEIVNSTNTAENAALISLIDKKDKELLLMAEEVGKLKEENRTLKKQIGYTSLPFVAEPGIGTKRK